MNQSNPYLRDPSAKWMSAIQRRELTWLWRGYIPFGKVTILDGDPGLGKSSILLDLASRFSVGEDAPDGRQLGIDPGGGVSLILSAEDDYSDTIVPRLQAAEADLDRIATIEMPQTSGGSTLDFTLPECAEDLEDLIVDTNAELVVIDPIMAYISDGVRTHSDASARRAIKPLAELAARTDAAIVLVRHLNKDSATTNALYRGGGSIAFGAVARSVLAVGKHPSKSGRGVLAQVKGNLIKRGEAPSLEYELAESKTDPNVAAVQWAGKSSLSADDLLRPFDGRKEAPERNVARAFLRAQLADGPVPSAEIDRRANRAGISETTLKRAKSHLGIRSRRITDSRGRTIEWELIPPNEWLTEKETVPTPRPKKRKKGRQATRSQKAAK